MASNKHHEDVLNIIHRRLIPDEEAKKARGEVFTPLPLVREMLFGLRKSSLLAEKQEEQEVWGVDKNGECVEDDPDDRVGGIPLELWRDPNTKWLDPANGIGNFPVVTFYMLDYQLGKHGPPQYRGDEHKQARRDHIVKNMLYMIEYNKGNVNTARKIFKLLVPTAESNICCADTLKMTDAKLKDVFGVNRFDVVMGNPPFNSGGVKSSGKGEEDYETIWHHFVHKSSKNFSGALQLLNTNGYLCFIHPSSWLHVNDNAKMNKVLLSYDLQFLRIFTDTQSGKLFSGGGMVRTAHYLLKKHIPGNLITILDTDNILEDLSRDIVGKDEFTIYSNNNSLINKAYTKFTPIGEIKDEKGAPYLKSNGKIKGVVESGKYRNIVAHTMNGVEVCKSSIEFQNWKTNKIILKGTRNLFHFDDYGKTLDSGKYGVYGNMGFYIFDTIENLDKFSKFFDTNIAKIIMNSTKEDQSFIEPKYLPDIREYDGEISDDELSKYLDVDLKHIKKYNFISNNQAVSIETNGCVPKGKKTYKNKAPAPARGGAGGPSPPSTGHISSAAAAPRRSPYPSRTRRNRRRA